MKLLDLFCPTPTTSKICPRKSITLPSSLCKPSLRDYFNWDDRGNDDYANRPVLLDLFAGGGGTAMGYYLAGFRVVGIDLLPQKHYPFEFIQADALTLDIEFMRSFDAIHASPPCQKYSMAAQQWRCSGKEYVDLVESTRNKLKEAGRPYVIENVPGAPLINPIMLNGTFFGLKVNRRRIFELSFDFPFILIPKDPPGHSKMGRPITERNMITPVGHFSNVPYAKIQMGIDWMTQAELAQAIPPAYTEFIGLQLRGFLEYNKLIK